MRDFAKTPEPSGRASAAAESAGPRFVVQRHRATRLHYDFRLEIAGVLVSWAVPKGPTLDPKVRRGAFHVEDHPLEYYDFEGVIPRGEYGGGDVIVWDAGTWSPVKPADTADAARAVADGELHIDLHGSKLRGHVVLVRTRTDGGGKEQWLLLHKNDEHAVAGWNPEDHPRSVLSGRTNDEVRADPDRLWRSDQPVDRAAVQLRPDRWPAVPAEELDALADLSRAGTWRVFGRDLKLTNLDQVMMPRTGRTPAVSKRDLLHYAAAIAPTALPYLTGRTLTMHRFPSGIDRPGIWSRQLPPTAPDWLPRHAASGGRANLVRLVVDEPAALLWAVNHGAVEWHCSTAPVEHPDRPSYALINIDPGDRTTWAQLRTLVRLHQAALDHLAVHGGLKLTGHRGVQIWIPVAGAGFEETQAWVERLSHSIGDVVPDLVTSHERESERDGRAHLDHMQNAPNKTLIVPYSPQAIAGATVSTPISWDELDRRGMRSDRFTIRTVGRRVAEHGDLFDGALARPQRLPDLG
jgi:bifunctional non-homologous end joining protein LigD